LNPAKECYTNRLLELELWHRWTCDTYKAFSDEDQRAYAWQVFVPKLALKFNFLFQALLAAASLHLAAEPESASSRAKYVLVALEYHNSALENFRAHPMTEMDAVQAQAVFAFCVMNLALALGSLAGKPSILENVSLVFGLLQGVERCFFSHRALIEQGPFCKAHPLEDSPWDGINPSTQEALDRLELIRSRESAIWVTSHCDDPNIEAIKWLQQCFGVSIKTMGVALIWMLKADLEFFTAIRKSNDVALLVLLHWAVLLQQIGSHTWWARESGKLLVDEVSVSLPRKDKEWDLSISWVRSQVGLP
jgi:hypothetical protein